MSIRAMMRRLKRRPDVLWVDLRYVEPFGHPTFSVWIERLRGTSGYMAPGQRSARKALRLALRAVPKQGGASA